MVFDISEMHNESPSKRAVELCLVMNSHIGSANRSVRVNTNLVSVFPQEEFGKFSPGIAWKEALAARYAEENLKIAATWFPAHAEAFAHPTFKA
jgi:hypothetical protein